MDHIFEISLPDPDDAHPRALYELCGDSLEHVLQVAVLSPPTGEAPERSPSAPLAYRTLGPIGPDVYADWRLVFDRQVTRWVSAIVYRRESPALLARRSPALSDLSRRLDDLEPEWADVPFMRTVRMLLLLEALLVPEIAFDSPRGIDAPAAETDWRRWRRDLHRKADALRAESADLRRVIRSVSGAHARLGTTDWCVSAPLLALLAVVYSQYEYYASPFWQAHSALRARDELQRKWGTALGRAAGLEHCRQFVALLVRHQSAVGKHVRQSGDARFLAEARRFAEWTGGTFSESTVLDALRLFSVLEEARLRRLPGTDPDTRIGPCRLNAGTVQPWDSDGPAARDWYLLEREDLSEEEWRALASGESGASVIGRVFRSPATLRQTLSACLASSDLPARATPELLDRLVRTARQTADDGIRRIAARRGEPGTSPDRANRTWTYASRLDVSDDDLRTFRRFVEQHYAPLLDAEHTGPAPDVAVFTFGLIQARDLKGPLERCVVEVARAIHGAPADEAEEVGVNAFGKHFRLALTAIPCRCGWSPDEPEVEHVVEVQLRDAPAAWGLLLPGDDGPGTPVADGGGWDRASAADLLSRLFDEACSRLGATQLALSGEWYVPFAIFQRMLEVVARLRPAESLSIAIDFDGRRRLVRVPAALDKSRHGHLIRCVAHYVHGVVLNRAMTEGFRTCDVSFDGLEDPPAHEPRAEGRMTAADWRAALRAAYRRNCYEVLVDKYLRDYNTERRSVALLDVSRPTTLTRPSPERVAAELQRWIAAGASQDRDATGAEPPVLLGLDVGATLTKIQFYAVEAGRMEPVGGAYQIGTPHWTGAEPGVDDPAARFAAELVDGVEQIGRADEQLASRLGRRRAIVLSVGVTWPGPVRDNHVAGTSRVLANFPPLSRIIAENRIETVLDLDVAGAIRRRFGRSHYLTRGREPLVAMLNDGDAAGYGTLVVDGRLPGRRLAVIKIGTGTSTTVLDDGQLVPGPAEGGKVMLDLGATPARDRPGGNEYPSGVANAYLSKTLLPAVAAGIVEREKLDFCVAGLGSREMGLFLFSDPRPLRDQCGLRELADEHSISVEILRRVLERKEEAEIELQHQVERILNLGGTEAPDRLRHLVEERGLIRLAEVLRLPTERVRHYFDAIADAPTSPSAGASPHDPAIEVKKQIALFRRKVAEPSVRALGEYLGDFLVLTCTQYGVDAFVVAGGVLRRRTGDLVRQAAIARAAIYGFRLRASGSLLEVVERPPWMGTGSEAAEGTAGVEREHPRESGGAPIADASATAPHENAPDPGYGTAGAAAFAAGEFLLRRKQRGLEELRSRLLRLPTNRCATLAEDRVGFDDGAADDVRLPDHALDADDVRRFLARQRMVVETESPPGTTRYVRIIADRSQAFETRH